MFDLIPAELDSYIAEFVALMLVALGGVIAPSIRRYFSLRAQAILRDALHRALETGVAQAHSADDLTTAEQAVEYAHRSVPEAIKALKAPPDVLVDLARSKIRSGWGFK